ncbi:MAG: anti-sigma factor family protein [Thermoanaerobaculia bacterium]
MQHLTEEQLILHHYRDDDAPSATAEHLNSCADCRAQYETLRRVLALVSDLPVPERGDDYADAVWNRLRWRLDRKKRRAWQSLVSVAAILAIAFVTGQWWEARQHRNSDRVTVAGNNAALVSSAARTQSATADRLLIVVVGDHLESSERMLTELANADPKKQLDVGSHQKRAQELVASNRIYRQTASDRGDKRMVSILSDLEPVLLELANAPSTLTPDQVQALQRRIDAQGLLFKVRLISAQTAGGESAPPRTGTSL